MVFCKWPFCAVELSINHGVRERPRPAMAALVISLSWNAFHVLPTSYVALGPIFARFGWVLVAEQLLNSFPFSLKERQMDLPLTFGLILR